MSIRRIFISLWKSFSKRRKYQFILMIVFSLINGLSEVFSLAAIVPFLAILNNPTKIFDNNEISNFLTFFNIQSSKELILFVTIIFCFLALATAIIKIINIWLNLRLSALIGSDISSESFLRTLYRPYYEQIKVNSSKVISTLTTDITSTTVFLNSTLQLITSLIVFISILITLQVIDWQISTFSFLLFGIFYGIIIFLSKKQINNNGRKISELVSSQVKSIQEPLEAIRDVLLDGNQNYYFNLYKDVDKPYRVLLSDNNFLATFPRALMETIGIIVIALISFFLVRNDNLIEAVPKLGAIALGFQRLLPSIQQLYSSWANLNTYKASVQKVLFLLKQEISKNILPITSSYILKSNIEFKNITFGYESNSENILEDFNFSIYKGEKIGIIGPSGSGKSTFVDVFMGLLKPDKGKIIVDGINLYDEPELIDKWRLNIAHVPQKIYLTDSTIRENIAFGIEESQINNDLIHEVSKKSQLANFIEKLPFKYETIVGERGAFLSGGQIQRIGLARALYKQASILIFDEATSALDTQTEKEVITSLESLSKDLTILVVAHRLSAIKNCDRILEFKKKK